MYTPSIIEYENLQKLNMPFFDAYKKIFDDILQSGWYVLGNNVKSFEQKFAEYCETKYCVGVANGLDALTLALRALKLDVGQEVLVPSNTYIATILSIVQNGLQPVLIEPDIRTYNMDPSKIEEKITRKTKVIMPVHLYGKLCDMEKICEIAKKHNLYIIEDCAQAHGASYKGKRAGSFGDFGAFSFYPTKNLGALGDAGALTCNSEFLKKEIMMLRNYGSEVRYYNELVGYNSRLDEFQAGFLLEKLVYLDKINAHKRDLANLYLSGLKEEYIKPVVQEGYYDVYHIFNVRHPRRDALREYLAQHNIKTEIHYPVTPNRQKAMQGILDQQDTPIAQEIHDTTLSLPISYFHTQDDIRKVIEVMNAF